MPFEWFVAIRFLREGRLQTLLILAGVSVGVGVIVFLSALIDGLQVSLVDKTLGTQAHIVVRLPDEAPRPLGEGPSALRIESAAQRLRSIDQWPTVLAQIDRTGGVVATCPTVNGSAFAERGTASRSVALRGIDAARFERVIPIRRYVVAGQYRVEGDGALIGIELARDLGVTAGDKLRLAASGNRDAVIQIAGVFDLGNKDVNTRWVLVSLRAAQTLLDLPGGISTIEVKVDEVFAAEKIAGEIARRTNLVADSWMTMNTQLLIGLKSQSSSRFMIEAFVIIAVALGIASVLVVSVVQKQREIGIMKAFGTPTGRVLRIFLAQGGIVGAIGALCGSGLGTILSLFFAGMARNPDGSPIFPVDLDWKLYLGASLVSLATGLIAAVAPARRAAKLDPVVAIRG